MTRNGKLSLLVFFILLISVCFSSFVSAISEEECKEKLGNLTYDEAKECEVIWGELLSQTEKKGESLAGEISLFDTQISLTLAQISQSQQKIESLEEEIAGLSDKIGRLNTSLDRVSTVLINRIASTYKAGMVDSLDLFLSSDSFSDFLSRHKYLKIVQIHDKKLLLAMEETKTNYEAQKSLKEEKQKELEQLKKTLEAQKIKLGEQKKDKEYLLTVTKQDEKRYQSLLATARAEQEAIKGAIRRILEGLENGQLIEKGDNIALMGNSGYPCCSTGTHLHFEILKNGITQNPASYLKNTSVIWNNSPDGEFSFNGDWDWPVDKPRITQGFGMTSFARSGFYGGNPHTGIDMVNEDHIIKAPKSGTLYKLSTICGRSCPMKYVVIDHGDGLHSLYLHVQ